MVKCSQVALYCGPMYHDITYSNIMTATEQKSYFELTRDILYLALVGEPRGVCYILKKL